MTATLHRATILAVVAVLILAPAAPAAATSATGGSSPAAGAQSEAVSTAGGSVASPATIQTIIAQSDTGQTIPNSIDRPDIFDSSPIILADAGETSAGTELSVVETTVEDHKSLEGNGTADDPYVITNATELRAIRDGLSASYVLGNNISAAETETWNNGAGFKPIGEIDGYHENDFEGTLDGKGHTISNLTIYRPGSSDIGLFGGVWRGGTIKNLRLANVNVTGGKFTGGLVAVNYGSVERVMVSGNVTGNNLVGGLTGGSFGPVDESVSTATVSGSGTVGILGGKHTGATITASYANGSVTGTSRVGGLVGFNDQGTIERSYATGSVNGDDQVGGLAGAQYSTEEYPAWVNGSYWDMNTTGQSTSAGDATGLTTAEMTGDAVPENMTAFDFEETWVTRSDAHPVLGWQDRAPNSAPLTRPDRYEMNENGELSVAAPGLLANDTDPNDDPITVTTTPVDGPTHGSVTLAEDGSFEYVPQNGYYGEDSFTYEVSDDRDATSTATVTIEVTAVAEDIDPEELNGSGTAADPYRITNASELQAVEKDLGANYTLATDIDASLTEQWNDGSGFDPIGESGLYGAPFNGTFDGRGHTISNLTVDRPGSSFLGLFAKLDDGGTVENLDIDGMQVTGTDRVGAVVGQSRESKLSNVAASDVVVSGGEKVGGLVGDNAFAANVRNSSASGTVDGATDVGGLVGANSNSVVRSSAAGTVTGDSEVGGLVGDNLDTVRRSRANATVKGGNDIGGLVGTSQGLITNSYAVGSVTGDTDVGGLLGQHAGNGEVRLSFAAAEVALTGSDGQTGGLVANTEYGAVGPSYWDEEVTGQQQSTGDGSIGLTTAEMTGESAQETMSELNFETVWTTAPGEYPALQWEGNDPPTVTIDSYRTLLVDEPATFDASASSDDGLITSYEWDIDGDGEREYTGEQITHTFTETGSVEIRLDVTDDEGANATKTRTVDIVQNIPPTLSVDAPGYVPVNQPTALRADASDRDDGIASIDWDTDTDSTVEQTGAVIETTFEMTGEQTVTVTASDERGKSTTEQVTFTVGPEQARPQYNVSGQPRFRVDRANTGHLQQTGGPETDIGVDWTFGPGGRIFTPPAVVNGTVYAGSYSTTRGDRIVAVDADNGSLRWDVSTTKPVGGSPTVANGTLYINTDAGELRALDTETGTQQWSKDTGVSSSAPVIVNETLYMSGNGGLYALDPATGEERFVADIAGGHSSPAVVDGTVYVGGGNSVYALDGETGSTEWVYDTSGRVEAAPAVVGQTVYVGSHDDHLYALDATNGFERWRFETGNRVRSSPAVADGTVYVGSDDGFIYAVDTVSGEQRWRFETSSGGRGDDNRVTASPIVAGETVYVGSHGYSLYALDTETGATRWSYPTGADIDATAAVVGERIYVGSIDGNLYALSGNELKPATVEPTEIDGPAAVERNESFAVSTTVTNTGDEAATQNVTLRLNATSGRLDEAAIIETKQLTLGAGATETILFDGLRVTERGEYKYGVFTADGNRTAPLTVEQRKTAFFDVNITGTNLPVTAGYPLTVEANVTNTGEVPTTQTVELTGFDGIERDNSSLTLASGEHRSLTLQWRSTDENVGEGNVSVRSNNDTSTVSVVLSEPEANISVTDYDLSTTEIGVNETLTVNATVENTGDTSGNKTVSLVIDGQTVTTEVVTVLPDDTDIVSFEWQFTESGEFNVTVGGLEPTTVSAQRRIDITKDGNPATDTTDDGLLNDVDGDGEFTVFDVQSFFEHQDRINEEYGTYTDLFNFAGNDPTEVSIFDVQALFEDLRQGANT